MLLIIEGLDRCGKSTLIKNLRKHYFTSPKTMAFHSSAPPTDTEDPQFWETQHYNHMFGQSFYLAGEEGYDIIADRLHLGASVYGKKYRNSDDTDIFALEEYWVNFNENHPYKADVGLIVLVDDPCALMKRDDGDSNEKSLKDFSETKGLFEEAYVKSSIPNKLQINVSHIGGFKNIYPIVEKFLNDIRG